MKRKLSKCYPLADAIMCSGDISFFTWVLFDWFKLDMYPISNLFYYVFIIPSTILLGLFWLLGKKEHLFFIFYIDSILIVFTLLSIIGEISLSLYFFFGMFLSSLIMYLFVYNLKNEKQYSHSIGG